MKWTDIYEIAEELSDTHKNVNPLTVRFTDLRKYVKELPDFDDVPDRCGEKVLEAIQQAWIDEFQ